MRHRLAGLQPRHFHFGYAVAQLDYHAAAFGFAGLMGWQTLRERVRIENRTDALLEMTPTMSREVTADAKNNGPDQRRHDFCSGLHDRHQ
jgi:hypothetical protein